MQIYSSSYSSYSTKLTNLHMIRSSSNHNQERNNYNLKQIFVPKSCPNLSVSNTQQLPLNQSVAAIVFGGGPDSELYPLTKTRSKGAIPIAANYRLIDSVISNCINSDITKIYAITQFNSTSLNSHLTKAYSGFGLGKDRFVEVIAAYQSLEDQGWFQGSADAIRRCLWVFEEFPVTEFLVLPGHHLYRMDYNTLIEDHRRSKADITIVGLSSATDNDSGFGLMEVDSTNLVTKFTINPKKTQQDLISVESRTRSDGTSSCYVPSTGIYVIGREQLVKLLRECLVKAKDMASEIIPGAISHGMKVKAHMFDGYWEDVKSVGAYYRANMESIKRFEPFCRFYDKQCPLYTMPRCLPPSSMGEAVITDSIIGDGCILDRCVIRGSVVGMRTRIANEVIIEDSIIVGSNIYEMEEDVRRKGNEKKKEIRIGIGEKSRIRKAIVDKNARIGQNVMIINRDNVEESNREAEGYVIREGIIVILRNAVILDDSII
ncbi:hypothetical protein Bca52824_061828 [Brassica carinata]|uniref:Nucleotidyl transferase domain-containing protein n=1 Tax=Brassica carinata TaxID=52824 RepID=A0A8X7QFQ3_BRACI|nr:hypothetical protein Bca52824_061828 [Brassica carinata]